MESKLGASVFLSAHLHPLDILLGRSTQCLNGLEVNKSLSKMTWSLEYN